MIVSPHRPSFTPRPDQARVSTLEAARILGLAVRSVQLMVDRGELDAWKTPGGHRRISRESLANWQSGLRPRASAYPSSAAAAYPSAYLFSTASPASPPATAEAMPTATVRDQAPRVLLIEDSMHAQNLVTLLVQQHFPQVQLKVAADGIAGIAMAGQFQPDVLIVDILLPGIDGATLITSLRSHPQFENLQLIVITSLASDQLGPYLFALKDIPVIHKPYLVAKLPSLLTQALARRQHDGAVTK